MLSIDRATYLHGTLSLSFEAEIADGSFVLIVGPSGAGKSTLLDLIAGFIAPVTGDIRFRGRTLLDRQPADRGISYLFQEHNLFPHLSVGRNVALGSRNQRLISDDRIDAALDQVGLSGMASRRPASLSGGERQRVAIARCLLAGHDILLLDEPFSMLDPALRLELATLLRDVSRRSGITVLLVSHQVGELLSLADRVLFIHDGRIRVDLPASRFLDVPVDPALQAYFGDTAANADDAPVD